MDVKKALNLSHDEYYSMTREELTQCASDNGYDVIYGDDKTLVLDLDTPNSLSTFEVRIKRINNEVCNAKVLHVYESESGYPHKHAVIKLSVKLDTSSRLFLQTFLGSDPIKEYLSFLRWRRKDEHPILLLRRTK